MLMKRVAILSTIVVLALIVLGRVGDALVDWLWFSSIGYVAVFWTIFTTRIVLFVVVLSVSTAAIWLSGALALRFAQAAGPSRAVSSRTGSWSPYRQEPVPRLGPQASLALASYISTHLPQRLLVAGAAVLLGLLTAVIELSNWDTVLRFLYQVPYGESDPAFGKDIGFYLFSLPAYVALKNWLLLILVFSAALAGTVYWTRGDIVLDPPPRRLRPPSSPMARRCSACSSC